MTPNTWTTADTTPVSKSDYLDILLAKKWIIYYKYKYSHIYECQHFP
jgi:hypothetical protein